MKLIIMIMMIKILMIINHLTRTNPMVRTPPMIRYQGNIGSPGQPGLDFDDDYDDIIKYHNQDHHRHHCDNDKTGDPPVPMCNL